MPHIVWDRRASRDLTRLYDFLVEKNGASAARAMKTIVDAVTVLEEHPGVGQLVDDLEPEHRELVIPFGRSAYVVRYRFHGTDVLVIAVRHGREAGY